MQDAYLSRSPGHSMTQSGDGLLLSSRETRKTLRLNRTAALAWLLCDGTLRRRGIVTRIRELYPDQANEISAEIPPLLDELLAAGRLRRRGVSWERPVLRISFSGFWETFDPGDNYLTWMLSLRYDVLVVRAGSVPDLHFFCASEGSSRSSWDRDRTLAIFCGSASEPRDDAPAELALSWDGPDGENQLRLPAWVFLVDWRGDLSGHPDRERLARYQPHRFGERFFASLERHAGRPPEADAAAEGPTPAVHLTVVPDASSPDGGFRLTVGMATFDDYDGVYFTVQALMLYHPEIAAELEILIVDNHPQGPDATALEGLAAALDGARYVSFAEFQGTSVRDVIFREARAPIVLCLDPHVLVPPGSLLRLVEYFEARPESGDLLQGPLLYDDHRTLSTHFDPAWSAGMFGVWATDERGLEEDGPPFEIPMQGLGLFACRRQAWPGFNPRFRGFGGEEGYLHEKFRRRGARTLCLPFLRWLHRFQRPRGLRFRNVWEERIRNYLIGHRELGLASTGLESHFRAFLGDEIYERAEISTLAEMASPFWAFDAVYGIGLEEESDHRRRFAADCERIGLGQLLRSEAGPPIPGSVPHETRDALSHRRILERAVRLGFESVLLIDSARQLPARAVEALGDAVSALATGDWDVLMLGHGQPEVPGRPWAVAYHHRIYRKICEDLPPEPQLMAAELRSRGGSLRGYLESLERVWTDYRGVVAG